MDTIASLVKGISLTKIDENELYVTQPLALLRLKFGGLTDRPSVVASYLMDLVFSASDSWLTSFFFF